MPRRLSDIIVDEQDQSQNEQPINTTSVRRLSDVDNNSTTQNGKQVRRLSDIEGPSLGQKIVGGVGEGLNWALGKGMATGEFDKMTPLGKTLDIVSRPSAAVKSIINKTIDETQDTQPGVRLADVVKAGWGGLHGKERVSANEMYKKLGVEGVPGLGFATEVALDPITYLGGGAAKLAQSGISKTSKLASKIPVVAKVSKTTGEALAPAVKAFKKVFSNTTGIPQLDDLINKYTLKREYLKSKEFNYGLKVRNVIQNISKNTKRSIDDISTEVVNLIELPGKVTTSTPEVQTLANTLKSHFSNMLTTEMKAGVPITALSEGSKGIQYFPRITTEEAKQYLKQAKIGNSRVWNPKIANAIKRKTGDFTLEEFNQFVKTHGLDSLGGNSVEQFFMKNPAYATAIRGTGSAKAVTSAEFIQDAGKVFGKTLKEMPYGQELPESLTKIYPALKGKVFNPEVINEITKTYEHIFNPKATGAFLKTFDTVVNYWKKWTLMPFAKYHLRNIAGNFWNNYLAGVDNPVVYAKAAALQRYGKTGKEAVLRTIGMTKQEANDIILNAKKLGVVSGTQFYGDIPTSIEKAFKKGGISPTKIGRSIGSMLENNARMAHFIDKIKKGLSPEDAAMSVKKFLFDYNDLSTFEKQVMRRIFPFYAWSRKNIPLQIEQMINQPQKYIPLMKLLTKRDEGDLLRLKYANPTLYRRLPIELRRDNDTVTYVPLEGLIPSADLARLSEPQTLLFDLLNPYIKTPMELLSGMSLYRKAPIERYGGQTESLLGVDMPVKLRYALTTILPQARMLSETDRLLKKNTRKEQLTPAEQVFHQSLSTVYKINLKDLKDKALQTIRGKVSDLQNGYFWAKRNERKLEMSRIKNTLSEIKSIISRIKEDDNRQNMDMEKTIQKQPGTSILKRLSDFIIPEVEAAEITPESKSIIADYIRKHEGLPPAGKTSYTDTSNNKTFGIGHLLKPGENPNEMDVEETFQNDVDIRIDTAKRLFTKFDEYPIDVQKALVDGVFRGEYKKGQKTVSLINSDQWDKVPAEYINREDYRRSKNPANKQRGVAIRMDENADIFKNYAESLKPKK